MDTPFLAPGTRLGAFDIVAPLGRGGMGAVYRVRNVLTGEARALKVILPAHLEDPAARARFIREMQIAASIDHPNVVRVFEPALDGDTLLLPMELVEGINLRQHLTTSLGGVRRLSPDKALPLLAGICEGVAAVHACGVIHRDLKPANVMLVREANGSLTPKVLDFGAARRCGPEDGHTADGIAIGTPLYMAPEQLRASRDLDPRADVYAVGVIAYELLTGRRPYEGRAEEIMARVFTRERYPTLRELVPSIPEALEAVILRALSYERDARFESVRALCDALARSLAPAPTIEDPRSSELVVERPSHAPRDRPKTALALAATGLALIVATAFLRRSNVPRPASARPMPVTASVPVAPAPSPTAPSVQRTPPSAPVPRSDAAHGVSPAYTAAPLSEERPPTLTPGRRKPPHRHHRQPPRLPEGM